MVAVSVMGREVTAGTSAPEFEAVRQEFERNFAERAELGAAVCVIVDGEVVVDLWGGVADRTTGRRWDGDTMNVIMSCSKGVTALCGNILIDRGLLDLDKPVAHYWPEFGQKGKAEILVRQVFTHQSGVAHVEGVVPPGGFNDWDLMIRLIEQTRPFWPPGTRTGYHGLTFGWLVGELIRRITGKTVGTFLREEVAEPLGVDCWLGLPEEHEHRVARTEWFDVAAESGIHPKVYAALTTPNSRSHKALTTLLRVPPVRAGVAAMMTRKTQAVDGEAPALPVSFTTSLLDPSSAAFKMISNMGGWFGELGDDRAAHAAEIPAGGAIASARGLAGVYAPLSLGGAHRGVRIVSENAIARMSYPRSVTDVDACIGLRTSYTLGFAKSWPNAGAGNGIFIGQDAFGTAGLGGQMAFADPTHRLAFAYILNNHGPGTGLSDRGQSLIDATYRALGSPGREPGFWVRPA